MRKTHLKNDPWQLFMQNRTSLNNETVNKTTVEPIIESITEVKEKEEEIIAELEQNNEIINDEINQNDEIINVENVVKVVEPKTKTNSKTKK